MQHLSEIGISLNEALKHRLGGKLLQQVVVRSSTWETSAQVAKCLEC